MAGQRPGLTLPAWPNTLFAMTTVQPPIDLKNWIEQNADKFQPPVSNRYLYDGRDFFVMVIKGPNARNDLHLVDRQDFYQLKGDIKVRIREGDRIVDHIVREGERSLSRQMFRIPRSGRRTPSVWLSSVAVRLEKKNTSFSTVKIAGHRRNTFISIARTSSSISARRCSISGTMIHAALARNAERKSRSRNR